MLNTQIGSEVAIDGRKFIRTHEGVAAHAIFGPYVILAPGEYAIEFEILPADDRDIPPETVCGHVDVTTNYGTHVKATSEFTWADLQSKPAYIGLRFRVDASEHHEYRIFANGRVPFLAADYRQAIPLTDPGLNSQLAIEKRRYPNPKNDPISQFFLDNLPTFGYLYENGVCVDASGPDVILTIDGVSIYARSHDDMRFIGEVFFERTYNMLMASDLCIVDVGMNSGLVSLMLAGRPNVKEVHAFEPFEMTYRRAVENLSLNPSRSAKIKAFNFGLSGSDRRIETLIDNKNDSGSFSAVGSATAGTPMQIEVRNAATILGPIMAKAITDGLEIIAKIDCEGSEFEIFEVLETAGLLQKFRAIMMEWHHMVPGKTHLDLISPLLKHGFVVFDTKSGQGLVYAVRT